MLIDKLKWDLRLYVLLGGTNPLRIYIYDEGMVRFATEEYESLSKFHIIYIHFKLSILNHFKLFLNLPYIFRFKLFFKFKSYFYVIF